MKGMLGATVFVVAVCLQAALVSGKRPDFVTDEIMEMVKDDKARCMAEHGTTEDLIEAVNDGKMENDRRVTCYMFCLFEAFSLVDEDGEFEVEMLVGLLPEHLQPAAEELVEACAKLRGGDACEHMYVMSKCVMEKRPDLWFLI